MVQAISNALSRVLARAQAEPATDDLHARREAATQPRAQDPPEKDRVELSASARQEAARQPIRAELVQRVKAEIADGTYLTEEKLQVAAERLQQVIRRET